MPCEAHRLPRLQRETRGGAGHTSPIRNSRRLLWSAAASAAAFCSDFDSRGPCLVSINDFKALAIRDRPVKAAADSSFVVPDGVHGTSRSPQLHLAPNPKQILRRMEAAALQRVAARQLFSGDYLGLFACLDFISAMAFIKMSLP